MYANLLIFFIFYKKNPQKCHKHCTKLVFCVIYITRKKRKNFDRFFLIGFIHIFFRCLHFFLDKNTLKVESRWLAKVGKPSKVASLPKSEVFCPIKGLLIFYFDKVFLIYIWKCSNNFFWVFRVCIVSISCLNFLHISKSSIVLFTKYVNWCWYLSSCC